jgi:hypothetical protein
MRLRSRFLAWSALIVVANLWQQHCRYEDYDLRKSDDVCLRLRSSGADTCSTPEAGCLDAGWILSLTPRAVSNAVVFVGPLWLWLPLWLWSRSASNIFTFPKRVTSVALIVGAAMYLSLIQPVRYVVRLSGGLFDPSGHVFVYGLALIPLWVSLAAIHRSMQQDRIAAAVSSSEESATNSSSTSSANKRTAGRPHAQLQSATGTGADGSTQRGKRGRSRRGSNSGRGGERRSSSAATSTDSAGDADNSADAHSASASAASAAAAAATAEAPAQAAQLRHHRSPSEWMSDELTEDARVLKLYAAEEDPPLSLSAFSWLTVARVLEPFVYYFTVATVAFYHTGLEIAAAWLIILVLAVLGARVEEAFIQEHLAGHTTGEGSGIRILRRCVVAGAVLWCVCSALMGRYIADAAVGAVAGQLCYDAGVLALAVVELLRLSAAPVSAGGAAPPALAAGQGQGQGHKSNVATT